MRVEVDIYGLLRGVPVLNVYSIPLVSYTPRREEFYAGDSPEIGSPVLPGPIWRRSRYGFCRSARPDYLVERVRARFELLIERLEPSFMVRLPSAEFHASVGLERDGVWHMPGCGALCSR